MKLASVVVGCVVFLLGIVLANVLAVPDAVNASIQLVNSTPLPDGGLRSGFDGVQDEILKGLKGLWSLIFSLGLTGLAYLTKTMAWGAQLLNSYVESKTKPEAVVSDPGDDWDMLEPLLLKAVEAGDREFVIQVAERMAGKPFISNPEAASAVAAKGASTAKGANRATS